MTIAKSTLTRPSDVSRQSTSRSLGLRVRADRARVAAYLDTHLTRFCDPGDASGGSRFSALLSDSIESGPQNWTDRILEHFVSRRGYEALRWLPALAGYLVGSPEQSDRFLFDYLIPITATRMPPSQRPSTTLSMARWMKSA